jgi:hypothetical protein
LSWNDRRFPLDDASMTIGRDPDCAIWIDVPGVSRRHAAITRDPRTGSFSIDDLGSTNGTFVNGRRLRGPVTVADGHSIQIGEADADLSRADAGRCADQENQAEIAVEGRRLDVKPKVSRASSIMLPTVLLSLDRVSMAFGHLPLLDHVNLAIEPGERIAVLGRNGEGKSTLLKVLAGELAPDSGVIRRAPDVRVARLAQEASGSDSGTVFDVVAGGLGELRDLVAAYHHAAVGRRPRRRC